MISHIFNNTTAHIKNFQVVTGFNRSDAVALANINVQGGLASFDTVGCFTTMPANLKDPNVLTAWADSAIDSTLIEHAGPLPSANPSTGWQFSWILSASGMTALAEAAALSSGSASSTAYIRYLMLTDAGTTYAASHYIWASLTYTLTPAAGVTFEHTWL